MLKKDFTVFTFLEKEELVKFYRDNKIDLIYIIVDGSAKDLADELEDYQDIKTFVHCVFSTARKHGTYYCTIHNFLNIYFHTNYPVLPHIVNKLPNIQDDLRKELSIPQDAYVFGGYGGKPSFDIGYVHDSIKDIAEIHEEIYFVFLNFEDFMKQKFNTSLKNVIFLPGTTDSSYKRRFINTCDSMLHARSNGETFVMPNRNLDKNRKANKVYNNKRKTPYGKNKKKVQLGREAENGYGSNSGWESSQ